MRRRLSKPAIFHFMLHVVAAGFLASIFVVLLSQWWVFDLFSHFRVQYVLMGFLLLPALLWLKKYWVAAIVIVTVVFHSVSLWPYLQGSRVIAGLEEHENLTLMFANIYYENPDFEKITKVLKKEKPEVVIFAELTQKDFVTLQSMIGSEYPFSEFEEGDAAYDISYFSKQKPESIEIPEFSQDNPSISLVYDWNDTRINILGIHPHSPMAQKSTEVRDSHLLAALEYASQLQGQTVVMGDFNISQFSPKFPKMLQKYGLVDTQLEFGLQPSWDAHKAPVFRIPIDQVIVSKDVKVFDRYIADETGSDHLPVVVKIIVK